MFYSTTILTKKGPLSSIWLAAHTPPRLTKTMISTLDIPSSITQILSPPAPMALRLSSNLMLGVVRIFSRKMKYLVRDSEEAVMRVRMFAEKGRGIDLKGGGKGGGGIDVMTIGVMDGEDVWGEIEGKRGVGGGWGLEDGGGFRAREGDITIREWEGGLGGDWGELEGMEVEREGGWDGEGGLVFTPEVARGISEGRVSSVEVFRGVSSGGSVGGGEVLDFSEGGSLRRESGGVGAGVDAGDGGTPGGLLEVEEVGERPRFSLESEGVGGRRGEEVAVQVLDDLEMRDEVEVGGGTPGRRFSLADEVGDDNQQVQQGDRNQTEQAGLNQIRDEDDENVENEGDRRNVSPRKHARPRARKRKIGEIADIIDEETELPSRVIREGLADTSDIVVGPNTRRKETTGGKRARTRDQQVPTSYDGQQSQQRPEVLLANLVPGFGESEELGEIFRQCYQPKFNILTGENKIDKDTRIDEEENEEDAVIPQRNLEDIEKMRSPRAAEDIPPPMLDDDLQPPEFQGLVTPPSKQMSMGQPDSLPQALSASTPQQAFSTPSQNLDISPPKDLIPSTTDDADVPPDTQQSIVQEGQVTLAVVAATPATVPEGEEADSDSISIRTQKMGEFLRNKCDGGEGEGRGMMNYTEKMKDEENNSRRTAARTFYELLNLANRNYVALKQEKAFGDIEVRAKESLGNLLAKVTIV